VHHFHIQHNHHIVLSYYEKSSSVKFSLSGRDDNLNRFQTAGNLFLTQTQADQISSRLRSPLVQLRSIHGFDQHRTLRDSPVARMIKASPPLVSCLTHNRSLLPPRCVLLHNDSRPELSYSASRNDLSGQLSERHAFNMTRGPSTIQSSVDTDEITISPNTTNI
jgi:hypothetical protein